MICLVLADRFFARRSSFGPIDAAALQKYRFFSKLGFFPVEQNSRRGAARFLKISQAILRESGNILWLTPQGRFVDARERSCAFRPGLGHLPGMVERACFLPLAVEYVFWEEKQPEILVRFGKPLMVDTSSSPLPSPADWTSAFERRLAETQEELAVEALKRDPADFECVLRGRGGMGGAYDLWRRICALWRGHPPVLAHGTK
jgi:1-acyl-sn-glycerol-3-phosphate acyltransferase